MDVEYTNMVVRILVGPLPVEPPRQVQHRPRIRRRLLRHSVPSQSLARFHRRRLWRWPRIRGVQL